MFCKSYLMLLLFIAPICAWAVPSHINEPEIAISTHSGFYEFNELGDANWVYEGWRNSEARANDGNGFLVSRRMYGDFALTVEFFAAENTNSGIFFRCQNASQINDKTCYEANIFDSRPDPLYRTGGVTNFAPPRAQMTSEGRWNRYEIHAVGSIMRVFLNGVETATFLDESMARGSIAFQFAMGGINFRNLRILTLRSHVKGLVRPARPSHSPIEGVWELTDFRLDDGKGNIGNWCDGSNGIIIYSEGYMSVAINCESEPSKMVHYSGPYTLRNGTVTHHVQNYSDPSLNQVFNRSVEMSDADHLDLIGPFGDGGKAVVSWKRR